MFQKAGRLIAAGAMLLSAPALAQDNPMPEDDGNSLTIGAGVGYVPTYEGSDDYRIIPAAIVRGEVGRHGFFTRGLQAYFDLIPEAPGEKLDLSFGPVAAVRLNRTSSIKDARVRALGELDTAIEIGGFAGIAKTGVITSDYDTLSFRVAYLKDVADAHDSHIISPSLEYGTPLSRFSYVGLGVSAEWVGDGYASYYFDVTPAGSLASGLAPFQADGGFKSWSANIFGAQALSGDLIRGLSLFAVGSYTRLQGDFRRSPIVADAGSPNQWFGAIGLAYSF
jgi:outer membrane scaffolding protein for murein synthesis (MipA/OmpV family)